MITNLYDPLSANKREKVNKLYIIIIVVIAISAIVSLVFMCIGVNTSNADARQIIVTALTVVVGWAEITLFFFVVMYNKHVVEHYDSMLSSDQIPYVGTLVTSKKSISIGGVPARVVQIKTADNEHIQALIFEELFKKVGTLDGEHTFFTVHKFIVAYGDKDENN